MPSSPTSVPPPPASGTPGDLGFLGGTAGALLPMAFFLGGVAWLGLAGAPDERGFWPILLGALALGLALARDRRGYADAVIRGMSHPLVLLMVMAWLLAGVLAAVMNASGFVQSLIWVAGQLRVSGGAFVAATFLLCAVVSTSTGTSLGTILLCAPLLYPAGGILEARPALLVGAILAGATFGDNVSPVSDTTIASAATQEADLGGVVRSRLKYALPAAAAALIVFLMAGGAESGGSRTAQRLAEGAAGLSGDPMALPMLAAPLLVIVLLFRRRHLMEGLMFGIVAALAVALAMGLIAPSELLYLDREGFIARGLLLDGLERGVGVSVFTLLLMGLVAGVEASGLLRRLVDRLRGATLHPRAAEARIVAGVSAAVLLTTHAAVAILTTGPLTRELGRSAGIPAYRRANLMDLTVSTYPFLLPFFIPTILAASMTGSGEPFGVPRVGALEAGLANAHSWALAIVLVFAVTTGFGRSEGGAGD